MQLRRSWKGLDAALVDTPAGATRVAASTRHRLGVHVGRPVRATCRCDGRTHRRLQSRGDIDLVPAGLPGIWEDDRSTSILRLSVSPALLETAAASLGYGGARLELAARFQLRDPRLQHIAWAFEAELRAAEPEDPLYGDSLAMALAAHLVRRYAAGRTLAEPRQGLSPRQLAGLTEYVDAHLDRSLSLTELAGVAGVGVTHLKTQFKRSTGLPVHRFVVEQRVARARLLLESRQATIAEVALQTGFTDQSHLARWMRRLHGVTPAGLRRR